MMSKLDELAPRALSREEIMPWIEVAQGARLNADVLEHLTPPRQGSFLCPSPGDPLRTMTECCRDFLEAA
ncbi:MAG: hypothetical protein VB036_14100, partial [Propionicimonas sp.]|nr:hypothetical protein [Propionicimonas sp.]